MVPVPNVRYEKSDNVKLTVPYDRKSGTKSPTLSHIIAIFVK